MFYYKTVSVNPKLPDKIAKLQELAYNLWFSWNADASELFRMIDDVLWEKVRHNPVRFLINVSQEKLDAIVKDGEYLSRYDEVMNNFDRYCKEDKWFVKNYSKCVGYTVAYFSAEFGLHESIPIYSGGLGLLAGDHTKAASDLGLSFVGVGLLYKHGYFTQRISTNGWQQSLPHNLNFSEMPIKPAVDENGNELIISLKFPHRIVFVKVWELKVGVATVYLLDTDILQNSQGDRVITGQLYVGDHEMRISQEIILGIGGVKALRALKIYPAVWHVNEGHSAFLCLERICELVSQNIPLAVAKEIVKATTLFTTHTPVMAGHDVFDAKMVEEYLCSICDFMGAEKDELIKLGKVKNS